MKRVSHQSLNSGKNFVYLYTIASKYTFFCVDL